MTDLGKNFEGLRVIAQCGLNAGDREPAKRLLETYTAEIRQFSNGTLNISGDPIMVWDRNGDIHVRDRHYSPDVSESRQVLLEIAEKKKKIISGMIRAAKNNKRPARGHPQPYTEGKKRRYRSALGNMQLSEKQTKAADQISYIFEMAGKAYVANCILWNQPRVDISPRPPLFPEVTTSGWGTKYLPWATRNNIDVSPGLTRTSLVLEVLIDHSPIGQIERREHRRTGSLSDQFKKALDDY